MKNLLSIIFKLLKSFMFMFMFMFNPNFLFNSHQASSENVDAVKAFQIEQKRMKACGEENKFCNYYQTSSSVKTEVPNSAKRQHTGPNPLTAYSPFNKAEAGEGDGDPIECNADAPGKVEDTCTARKLTTASTYLGRGGTMYGAVVAANKPSNGGQVTEKIGNLNLGLAGVNAAVSGMCYTDIRKCESACTEKIKACETCIDKITKKTNFVGLVQNIEEIDKEIKQALESCTSSEITKEVENKDEAIEKLCSSEITSAEEFKTKCSKEREKAAAAMGQGLENLLHAAINYTIADHLKDNDGKKDKTPPPPNRPTVPGSGSTFDLGENPSTCTGSNCLTANIDDPSAGETPPDPGNELPPSSGTEDSTAEAEANDKKDSKTPTGSPPLAPGSSLAGNTDDDEEGLGKGARSSRSSYGRGFGSFAGGVRSGGGEASNHENDPLGKGSGKKTSGSASSSSDSRSKRTLSSANGKHKNIFEHMTTLIKSYCTDRGKNCQ